MWPFKRRRRLLVTTLTVDHPLNYLGVSADPIVLYHPTLGQVIALVEAPAPEFLPDEDVFQEGTRLFDIADANVVPSYYYKRVESHYGYLRA